MLIIKHEHRTYMKCISYSHIPHILQSSSTKHNEKTTLTIVMKLSKIQIRRQNSCWSETAMFAQLRPAHWWVVTGFSILSGVFFLAKLFLTLRRRRTSWLSNLNVFQIISFVMNLKSEDVCCSSSNYSQKSFQSFPLLLINGQVDQYPDIKF